MNNKRSRSFNWEADEKQLLRFILRNYAHVIENKKTDSNAIHLKNKAWDEVLKKFNEQNGRQRELHQIKTLWKRMKIRARRSHCDLRRDIFKMDDGIYSGTADDEVVQVKSLMNHAKLSGDQDKCDTDGINQNSSENVESVAPTPETCAFTTIADSEPMTYVITFDDEMTETNEELAVTTAAKKVSVTQQKPNDNVREKCSKSKKEDYVNSGHSKTLLEEEHRRRMEMAEQEHIIKISILKEQLKCAILKREFLELKKQREQNLDSD